MKKVLTMVLLAMCVTLQSDAQKKNPTDSTRVKVISGNIVVSPNANDSKRFKKAMKDAGKTAGKVINGALNIVGSCSSQNASTSTSVNPSTPYRVVNMNANKKNSGQDKKAGK